MPLVPSTSLAPPQSNLGSTAGHATSTSQAYESEHDRRPIHSLRSPAAAAAAAAASAASAAANATSSSASNEQVPSPPPHERAAPSCISHTLSQRAWSASAALTGSANADAGDRAGTGAAPTLPPPLLPPTAAPKRGGKRFAPSMHHCNTFPGQPRRRLGFSHFNAVSAPGAVAPGSRQGAKPRPSLLGLSANLSASSNASGSSAGASAASSMQVEALRPHAVVRLNSRALSQGSALPSPSRDSVASRASTQLNSSSSSTQPLSSQPMQAWATPEKSKREGKSILELNSKPIDYTLTEVCRMF